MSIENIAFRLGRNLREFAERNDWTRAFQSFQSQLTAQQIHQGWAVQEKPRRDIENCVFLLLRNKEDGTLTSGLHVDPSIHSSFTPAVLLNVESDDIVGLSIPLAYQFVKESPSPEVLLTMQVNHVLKLGLNPVYPNAEITTDHLPPGKYSFQLVTLSDVIRSRTHFSLSETVQATVIVEKDGSIDFQNTDKLVGKVSHEDLRRLLGSSSDL